MAKKLDELSMTELKESLRATERSAGKHSQSAQIIRQTIEQKRAFIVRAVNSHEAMVQACRTALAESVGQPSRRLSESTLDDLRAALALAQEEAGK